MDRAQVDALIVRLRKLDYRRAASVVGLAAGGYTVLALAGGTPDLNRLVSHCKTSGDDPIFCSKGMTCVSQER